MTRKIDPGVTSIATVYTLYRDVTNFGDTEDNGMAETCIVKAALSVKFPDELENAIGERRDALWQAHPSEQ
ncbi:hypothetical protein [Pseudomonas sp. UBA6753]|uniref:hypothetical protein n=1 Tax=Pseudomonas sp. UBA6753 TaxID=1947336 RepID=UPI00257E9C86|nr:hypothetical protein [Pseudomonas sp. UBA6753]